MYSVRQIPPADEPLCPPHCLPLYLGLLLSHPLQRPFYGVLGVPCRLPLGLALGCPDHTIVLAAQYVFKDHRGVDLLGEVVQVHE